MSRFEGDFSGETAPSLDVSLLRIELAGQQAQLSARDRQRAIACYLSASEGWRNASQRLGGAFAGQSFTNRFPKTGLTDGQEE